MRRAVAVVMLSASGLWGVAACGGGDERTGDVCNQVDADASTAAEQFAAAGAEIGSARAAGDQPAAEAAVADARSAAADLAEVIRAGADRAEDEQLQQALETWADELEALSDGLDAERLLAGEEPDDGALQAAADRVETLCQPAEGDTSG